MALHEETPTVDSDRVHRKANIRRRGDTLTDESLESVPSSGDVDTDIGSPRPAPSTDDAVVDDVVVDDATVMGADASAGEAMGGDRAEERRLAEEVLQRRIIGGERFLHPQQVHPMVDADSLRRGQGRRRPDQLAELRQRLAQSPLCAHLPLEALEDLEARALLRAEPVGATLLAQGDLASGLSMVVRGQVKIAVRPWNSSECESWPALRAADSKVSLKPWT